MSGDPLAILDQLDEARAKGTPGPWRQDDEFPQWFGTGESTYIGTAPSGDNAALIVAAVNALPQLTAALRYVLAKCDRANALAEHRSGLVDATDIRTAITAALTPEQVQP